MNGFDHYREIRKNFQWNVPDDFNFGRDVVDRYASDRSKVAFFYEDAGGGAAKYTFREVSRVSDRLGNVLQGLLVANYPGIPVKPGSMGLPTPGHDVAVIDDKGNEVPPGEIGEIAVKELPKTSSGKIRRVELRNAEWKRS